MSDSIKLNLAPCPPMKATADYNEHWRWSQGIKPGLPTNYNHVEATPALREWHQNVVAKQTAMERGKRFMKDRQREMREVLSAPHPQVL